jgi:hypothetical protein
MTIKAACIDCAKIHIVSAYRLLEFEYTVAPQKDPGHVRFDHVDLRDTCAIQVWLAQESKGGFCGNGHGHRAAF